jgi:ubiquinone/menaquinone biosynthesis C-methylase UbiE
LTSSEADPRQDWSGDVARAWERHRERVFESWRFVSDWLIEAIEPRSGQTVVELAAGPGETGFIVAERIGPQGKLISTDFIPEMVEAVRREATARRLTNIECRVMDAQTIDLPWDCADGVLCRFGLMLMPDPAAVLTGIRRILRPGGRFAYSVFGTPDRNPWITTVAGAIMGAGHDVGVDPFAPGGLFSLAELSRNRRLLDDAGFSKVKVEELAGAISFGSLDDYWSFQTSISGRFAVLLGTLTQDQRQDVRSRFEELAKPYGSDGHYELPSSVIVASAG